MTQDQAAVSDTQENAARERRRIIQVAAKLFATNGFHATSLSELTQACGLTRGGFYYYIDAKETLLFEIVKQQIDSLNSQTQRMLGEEGDTEGRIREMAAILMANGAAHKDEWTVFFREYRSLSEPKRSEIIHARNLYESYWLTVIRDGMREGLFECDAKMVVKALLGMFNHTYLWYDPAGPLPPDRVAEIFVDIVLDGIRAKQRA